MLFSPLQGPFEFLLEKQIFDTALVVTGFVWHVFFLFFMPDDLPDTSHPFLIWIEQKYSPGVLERT